MRKKTILPLLRKTQKLLATQDIPQLVKQQLARARYVRMCAKHESIFQAYASMQKIIIRSAFV